MPSFAERYEAACQRDGTLRARKMVKFRDVANGNPSEHEYLLCSPWGWYAHEDIADAVLIKLPVSAFACEERDAIAHATVAMLQWILRVMEPCWADPYFDAMEDGTFNMRVSVGEDSHCENIDRKPLHDCLIAAVEKVLDARDGK